MKERPILFSGEMIRAILDGRKTQTRRVMKPQPTSIDHKTHTEIPYNGSAEFLMSKLKCPYGEVGDRLWVREAWCPVTDPFVAVVEAVGYAADKKTKTVPEGSFKNGWTVFSWEKEDIWKFRPSIHMPRWASRITLEITDVRAERLQDISEEDAKAEGMSGMLFESTRDKDLWCTRSRQIDPEARTANYRGAFNVLWDKINGKTAPWGSNPWVWVVEFKRVEVDK